MRVTSGAHGAHPADARRQGSSINPDAPVTSAETVAVSILAAPLSAILAAYLVDLAGLRFPPVPLLLIALAASAGTFLTFRRAAIASAEQMVVWSVVVLSVGIWLFWLARPSYLPLSTGPDLTHHLILIRYIEEHWRLVHDPSLERFLGEMAQYTPGSHILVALAGAWSRTDGLRALHGVQAVAVALEAGFLVLIAGRLLPTRAPRLIAIVAPVLLLASPRYFLGAFTEFGFLAQVIAQLFVISMWWALAAWSDAPDTRLCVVFGLAGAATFLSWPVYVGPPALTFFLLIVLRRERVGWRIRQLLAAFLSLALFAAIYLIGRLGWLQLAGTGGTAPWPSVGAYGWPLVVLAAAGFLLAAARAQARPTALFLLAVVAQSAAFYVLARRSGAPQPYMALKMFYLLLWPMAACAALAVGEAWARIPVPRGDSSRARIAALALVAVTLALTARPLWRNPSVLHPLPPAVALPLYDAGRWARLNLPAQCVEYLVGDDETAYWLHLAVLGNPRMSDRTGDNSTYEPKDAVMRWLTPNGLPYAIADLPALPRDVREELDIVQQFGTAAIVKRRGPASCDTRP